MALKKKNFSENEIAIFEDACIYKRGEYWHFRMWLAKEKRYVRRSLKTTSRATAVELAKDTYLDFYANLRQGKTFFSITAKEGAEKYLEARRKDWEIGNIVRERYLALQTHIKHWVEYVGKKKKLRELRRTDCEGYYEFRMKKTAGKIRQTTVEGEQVSINACMRWLYKEGETSIDGFEFKKIKKIDDRVDAVRRQTLSNEEYERLYRAMRTYCSRTNKKIDEDELRCRKLVQHFVLIATNSGLRIGELKQLKWDDVVIERHKDKTGSEIKLARINIRAETSKVRKSRTVLCRNGQYFERLAEIFENRKKEDFIFSMNGKEKLKNTNIYKHFNAMLMEAKINDYAERGIVPYSLRHFMITQRIMAGLSFRQVADMCGTSIAMIEKTYWHLNDEMRKTAAMADYIRREDGTIEVI